MWCGAFREQYELKELTVLLKRQRAAEPPKDADAVVGVRLWEQGGRGRAWVLPPAASQRN